MFSQSFLIALKLNKLRQYKLAQKVGINPGLLSKWVCKIQTPRKTDPRLIRLGRILGLEKKEIFEEPKARSEHEDGKQQPSDRLEGERCP